MRFEVLNAQNDVFGGILEVLSRDVTDFQLIGAGQDRTGRPFGQFKSVVTHFRGQNGTSLHVQLRSPIQTAADLKEREMTLPFGKFETRYLRVPFVQRFDVDELFFTVGTGLDTILFASNDDHLVVAQIPGAITVTDRRGLVLLIGLNEWIWIGTFVTFFSLNERSND